MSNPNESSKCLICSKMDSIMISLQEVLMGCQQFSVAQVLEDLNFLNISSESSHKKNLCFICVAKIQYCFEFKSLCRQTEKVLQADIASGSTDFGHSSNSCAAVPEEHNIESQDPSGLNASQPLHLNELHEDQSSGSSSEEDFIEYKYPKVEIEELADCASFDYEDRFVKDHDSTHKQQENENFQLNPCYDGENISAIKEEKLESEDQLDERSDFQSDYYRENIMYSSKNAAESNPNKFGSKRLKRERSRRNSEFRDEKIYNCKICEKTFHFASLYRDHEVTHTELRKYKCCVCEKSFKHRRNLTEHERIHSGEKPFVCVICDKAFSRSSHLKRHTLTHN